MRSFFNCSDPAKDLTYEETKSMTVYYIMAALHPTCSYAMISDNPYIDVDNVQTVQIDFHPARFQTHEQVIEYLHSFGFEVARLIFVDILYSCGISEALITLESYNDSKIGKDNIGKTNRYFIQLSTDCHIINPHYNNPQLISLLRTKYEKKVAEPTMADRVYRNYNKTT